MHASTRALIRVRFRRGTTRSSAAVRDGSVSSIFGSVAASTQMEGASQCRHNRATHLRTSNDFSSISFRYTTSRLCPLLHGRELDVPEIRLWLQHGHGVNKSLWLAVDLRHNPGPC